MAVVTDAGEADKWGGVTFEKVLGAHVRHLMAGIHSTQLKLFRALTKYLNTILPSLFCSCRFRDVCCFLPHNATKYSKDLLHIVRERT